MQLLHLLVLAFATTVAASNCYYDDGNFLESCNNRTFNRYPHFAISIVCQQSDPKSNINSTLSLSKCIGYNNKEDKLVWRVPSCNATTSGDANGLNALGDMSVFLSSPGQNNEPLGIQYMIDNR